MRRERKTGNEGGEEEGREGTEARKMGDLAAGSLHGGPYMGID